MKKLMTGIQCKPQWPGISYEIRELMTHSKMTNLVVLAMTHTHS